jgi:hypothetical protein
MDMTAGGMNQEKHIFHAVLINNKVNQKGSVDYENTNTTTTTSRRVDLRDSTPMQ